MVLCVSGNVTVDKVLKTADRLLKPSEKHTIHNVFENEPYEIVKPYVEQEFSVSMPIFNLGLRKSGLRKRRRTGGSYRYFAIPFSV